MISLPQWQVSCEIMETQKVYIFSKVTITSNISHLIMLAILLALGPLIV